MGQPVTIRQNFGCDQTENIADDKLNVDRMVIFLLDRVENTVGKGENAGYQHFLLFPWCFPKPSITGDHSLKAWLLLDLNTIPNNCVRENSL